MDESQRVESQLLCLQVLHGEATGQKIGNLVLDALKSRDISVKNCIAFGSDNANVMIGKKNGVAAVVKEVQDNLIVVGCPCHLINLRPRKEPHAYQQNLTRSLWTSSRYFLEKSAKTKDRLVGFQGMHSTEVHKILKRVPTRWLLLGLLGLNRLLD